MSIDDSIDRGQRHGFFGAILIEGFVQQVVGVLTKEAELAEQPCQVPAIAPAQLGEYRLVSVCCARLPAAAALQALPGKVEALVDIRNLLAQGYVPVMAGDGRTVYLVQSARAVRGGLAFTF